MRLNSALLALIVSLFAAPAFADVITPDAGNNATNNATNNNTASNNKTAHVLTINRSGEVHITGKLFVNGEQVGSYPSNRCEAPNPARTSDLLY